MKSYIRVIKFHETNEDDLVFICPHCAASDEQQNDLGMLQPDLVKGDHSIELYLRQCDNCENFWIIVYDDFPTP